MLIVTRSASAAAARSSRSASVGCAGVWASCAVHTRANADIHAHSSSAHNECRTSPSRARSVDSGWACITYARACSAVGSAAHTADAEQADRCSASAAMTCAKVDALHSKIRSLKSSRTTVPADDTFGFSVLLNGAADRARAGRGRRWEHLTRSAATSVHGSEQSNQAAPATARRKRRPDHLVQDTCRRWLCRCARHLQCTPRV